MSLTAPPPPSPPQSLKLRGWILTAGDLRGIEGLTGLRELHIQETTNFPGTGLCCLSALSALRSLVLEDIEYPSTIQDEFCGLSKYVADEGSWVADDG